METRKLNLEIMQTQKLELLKLKRLGIDTYHENILFLRADCSVCVSEGFTALTRVLVQFNGKQIVATLNVVYAEILGAGEAALSEIGFLRLGAQPGDCIEINHLPPIDSLKDVRAKIYGNALSEKAFQAIIKDIASGYYAGVELSAFITACSGNNLTLAEIIGLTKAMIESGTRLNWNREIVVDKHCVGGLPGNRTTPIVVAIVTAAGLTFPKTSSRAITSPAGTADTMEVITPVDLSLETMQSVVEKEGGCIAWGGSVNLSPADDVLISVERTLDIDSEGQMIASVLSKKAAAGSTHVVIDIPVGPTAKVRSMEEANLLEEKFIAVGKAIGLLIDVMITDGSQPIGRGIGPALEAKDCLAVLKNDKEAPLDLRLKSLQVAARILELAETAEKGKGLAMAMNLLDSGAAYKKFERICMAQGGLKIPGHAAQMTTIKSEVDGTVIDIDNRKIAKIAKLAGAPSSVNAGVVLLTPIGTKVSVGDVLFEIYAEAKGELTYALNYLNTGNQPISIV